MILKRTLSLSSLLLFSFSICGCASFGQRLKAFLGGKSVAEPTVASSATKYSEQANIPSGIRRQYKRTTRKSLEEEAALHPQSGSLWVMEGQGGYLFAQNIIRMIGDPLAVTLEGDPKDQLQMKVDVIKRLMQKFEDRQKARRLAAQKAEEGDKKKANEPESPEQEKAAAKADEAKAKAEAANQKQGEGDQLAVRIVPTRVVERMPDGNYRVKGSQPFMIGEREYKVIVTGIVRAEDFNDEGLSATKLMDSKFDVVSARSKETP